MPACGRKLDRVPSVSDPDPCSVRLLGLTFWPAVPLSTADATYQLLPLVPDASVVSCWYSVANRGRTPVPVE